MPSREIFVSNLLLTKSPILKTLPGFGLSKGSKLWPQRSSVFQCRTDDDILKSTSVNDSTIYPLTFSGTKSSTSILELSGT
jgi:hypothetical protein